MIVESARRHSDHFVLIYLKNTPLIIDLQQQRAYLRQWDKRTAAGDRVTIGKDRNIVVLSDRNNSAVEYALNGLRSTHAVACEETKAAWEHAENVNHLVSTIS